MDERYKVGQLTDEVDYGKYFEAEDTLIQRKVQIFRYNTPTSVDEDDWKETFNSLSAELATVSHPGLPIIYAHGIDDDGPYTIRQLLDSTSLNERLSESGPLTEYEAWELAHQMLEIHDAAKPAKIFHGALNPDYIGQITRPSGKKLYCITNYGLADISNKMAEADDYLGAPYLISPEQAEGKEATEISQLYAIGQLLFHAMCGGHPWIEDSLDSIKEKQIESPLSSITEYNAGIPTAMAEWTQKLLAINPSDRFQSYEEATKALPEPISSAPVPILTEPVRTVPAGHTTATQTVSSISSPQGVTAAHATAPAQVTTAAEDFAAQQATSKKAPIFKNPLVLGGAGALLLAIILIFALSGGDEKDASADENAQGSAFSEISRLPREGLVAYFDFNSETLNAYGSDTLKIEALGDPASFSRNGQSGKGLLVDADHYYRLPVKGTPLTRSHKDVSVAFWMKTVRTQDQELAVSSSLEWSQTENVDADGKVWTPENARIIGRTWNLVTLTFSKDQETVTVYLDGEAIDSSSTSEISNLHKDPFIYIGCNNQQQATSKAPITIDGFAVWSRRLSDSEVKSLLGE